MTIFSIVDSYGVLVSAKKKTNAEKSLEKNFFPACHDNILHAVHAHLDWLHSDMRVNDEIQISSDWWLDQLS